MQNTGGLLHEYIKECIHSKTRLCHISAALTFDPHPLEILAPSRKPALLTPLAERLRLIAETGVSSCLLLPFTRELAALTPEEFVSQILGAWLVPDKSIALAAGANWRFGRGGAGDLNTAAVASHGKIKTLCVPSVAIDGEPVSSSAIRRLIIAGDLARASLMLGRHYEIRGVGAHGRGVGAKIGFATANIAHRFEVMPPCGVYAVEARIISASETEWLPAIANLGLRPTFIENETKPTLEVHILNGFDDDLHDAEIAVRFISKIRDERKFASPDELVRQIEQDTQSAQNIFNKS